MYQVSVRLVKIHYMSSTHRTEYKQQSVTRTQITNLVYLAFKPFTLTFEKRWTVLAQACYLNMNMIQYFSVIMWWKITSSRLSFLMILKTTDKTHQTRPLYQTFVVRIPPLPSVSSEMRLLHDVPNLPTIVISNLLINQSIINPHLQFLSFHIHLIIARFDGLLKQQKSINPNKSINNLCQSQSIHGRFCRLIAENL